MLFCGLILIASIDTTDIDKHLWKSKWNTCIVFLQSIFLLFFPWILNGLDFGKQNKTGIDLCAFKKKKNYANPAVNEVSSCLRLLQKKN